MLENEKKYQVCTNSLLVEELTRELQTKISLTELRLIFQDKLKGKGLKSLPDCISKFWNSLRIFDVRNNPLDTFPKVILSLVELTTLNISRCSIDKIPQDISALKKLRILSADDNNIKEVPSALYTLDQLEELYLSKNKIVEIPDAISDLTRLQRLDLSDNDLASFPIGITNLDITKLLLGGNRISELPQNIGSMRSLKYFDVSQNKLKGIPKSIGELSHLRYLKLVENSITQLPEEVTNLELQEDAFLIGLNNLQMPPQKVCEKGLESMRGYFDEEKKMCGIHNQRLKLVLLGESRAGKTSLAEVLRFAQDECVKEDERTVHVDFYRWRARPDVDRLEIFIVDFAGERKYLLTHHFFLSDGSLYVIVCDLWKYDCSEESFRVLIGDWIDTILSKVPNATILIVATHIDKLINEGKDEILRRCHNITERTKMRSKAEKGPFISTLVANCAETCCNITSLYLKLVPVSCTQDLEGIQVLREEIFRIADDSKLAPIVNCHLFPSWINLEEAIPTLCDKNTGSPVLKIKEVLKHACKSHGLDERSATSALMYFNSVGTILYFCTTEELSKYVIADPKWAPYLFKQLFRTDLKDKCPYDKQYFNEGFSEQRFNQAMDSLVYNGKLSTKLLRLVWKKLGLNDDAFNVLVLLLSDFGLITKEDKKGNRLVPWFFEEDIKQEKLKDLWPGSLPADEIEIGPEYSISAPYDLFVGLFAQVAVRSHTQHDENFCRHWKKGLIWKTPDGDVIHCDFDKGQNEYLRLSVRGRSKQFRLRNLWLAILKLDATIKRVLENYKGIDYNKYSRCPNVECTYLFEVDWFDSSQKIDNCCDNESKAIRLDLLRPPLDILAEFVGKSCFKGELTVKEKNIISSNIGSSFEDFGKALGIGSNTIDSIKKQCELEPKELVLTLLHYVSDQSRGNILKAFRSLDPTPQPVIDLLLDEISSTSNDL